MVWGEESGICAHADGVFESFILEEDFQDTEEDLQEAALSFASNISRTLDIYGTARHQHKLAQPMMLIC